MHKPGRHCTPLLEKTADALSGNVVALMLLSVQKDNLELNINYAVQWYDLLSNGMRMRGADSNYRAHTAFIQESGSTEKIINICVLSFPSTWVSCNTYVLNCPLLIKRLLFSIGSVNFSLFCYNVLSFCAMLLSLLITFIWGLNLPLPLWSSGCEPWPAYSLFMF